MDRLAARAREGEILPPDEWIQVIGTTNPFFQTEGRINRYLLSGLTVKELLREALEHRPEMQADEFLSEHLVVYIGDHVDPG